MEEVNNENQVETTIQYCFLDQNGNVVEDPNYAVEGRSYEYDKDGNLVKETFLVFPTKDDESQKLKVNKGETSY